MWLLGYPAAALRDNDDALRDAREIGQAQTLMYALLWGLVDPRLVRKLRVRKRAT
jgi:hypothetical protein